MSGSVRRRAPAAWHRLQGQFGRRPVLPIVIGLVILALWAVLALVLWQSRDGELERGRSAVANLARLLDEQTYRVVQTTDLVLRHVNRRLQQVPPLPVNDPDFRAYLRATLAELPHLRALFVIGPDGFIIHDTDYPDTPRVSLADRGYFTVHRDRPNVGLHIGQPLRSRSAGQWFVPISRRLEAPGGGFGGVSVAAVEPRFFEAFYDELNLGPNDAVSLFDLNATLIARTPEMPEVVGRAWPDLDLFREIHQGAGSGGLTVRNFGGVESLLAYRRVGDYPLVAVVTLSISDVLAGWRRLAIVTAAGAACISLMIVVISFLVAKRHRERTLAMAMTLHLQKMETLGRMTGSVAHDFSNVLGVVASSLARMRKDGATAPLLEAGEQAVARGSLLTRQLLGFAKRRELALRAEDPNELLRSLEPIMRHAVELNIQVALDLAPGHRRCLIDQAQFDAAVMNLVINAAQAMPGGGRVRVATEDLMRRVGEREPPRRYVSLRVTDTGCGIDAADRPKIFEPFYTTKGERGTGLGLFQVRDFMKRVGGEVHVESEVGRGTTVELRFPCLDEDSRAGA